MASAVASFLWSAAIFGPLLYILAICIYNFVSYTRRCAHLMKLPGLPPRNWILGHLSEFPGLGEEGLDFLKWRLQEHPRMSYIFIGPFPNVQIVHSETAKAIFRTSEPKPLNHAGAYRLLIPWLGKGLLVSGGKQWARNRKLLTPAFHFDILKPYMKINNNAVEILMDKMQSFYDREEYFEVFNHISLCTFDIILRCAFSYDNNCQLKGASDPYVKAVSDLASAVPERLLRPWLYPSWIFRLTKLGQQFANNCNYVHKLADEIIAKRKDTLSQAAITKDKRYLDFLDILLTAKDADGKGMSAQEIRQEVDTFMFEGHDTTASGISWTLYSLAKHPEHMKKCQEEIDKVLQDRDSDTIEWNDLPKLTYLTQCLKEALRFHTPVPYVQRITTKDMYLDGYFIPQGTSISLHLYAMLHNPDSWHDPDVFMPERFAPDQVDKMDSHQFVPFAAGPRNCIGQHFAMHEMKAIVGRILRRFDLVLKPGHEVRHVTRTVMKAENGIYMMAKPRDPSQMLMKQ